MILTIIRNAQMHTYIHGDMYVHTHTHTMLGLSCDSELWHQKMQPLVSVAAAVAANRAAMPQVSSAPELTTFEHCPC